MLKPAFYYKEQIQKLYENIILDDAYLYYFNNGYTSFNYTDDIADSDWATINRVSINEDGKIFGLLSASVSRDSYTIDSLAFINFNMKAVSLTFARDMQRFFHELLVVKGFHRVKFNVTIGNPAEYLYDEFITRVGGSIVGTFHSEVRLQDGKLHDRKYYEILKEKYRES